MRRSAVGSASLGMNPIQSFHCKLRSLAAVLDGETARLTRALDGEDSGERARAGTVVSGRRPPPGWAKTSCASPVSPRLTVLARRPVSCV